MQRQAIHKKRIADGEWSCSATSPGVRRIPTPIVPPTLTARPKPRPRTRRSWTDFSDAIRPRSIRRNDLFGRPKVCANSGRNPNHRTGASDIASRTMRCDRRSSLILVFFCNVDIFRLFHDVAAAMIVASDSYWLSPQSPFARRSDWPRIVW